MLFKRVLLLAVAGGAAAGGSCRNIFYNGCRLNHCLKAYTSYRADASEFCSTYIRSTSTEYVTPTVTVAGAVTIMPRTISIIETIPDITTNAYFSECESVTKMPLETALSSACSCLKVDPTTVTTTSTAPAITITSAPAAPSLSCPQSGVSYAALNGKTFTPSCGSQEAFINSGDAKNLINNPMSVGSFTECLELCSTTANCVTVNWAAFATLFRCYLLGLNLVGDKIDYEGWDAAKLVTSGGGASTL